MLGQFEPESVSDWNGYVIKAARYKWIDYLRSHSYKVANHQGDIVADLQTEPSHFEKFGESDEIKNHEKYISLITSSIQEMGVNCRNILKWFYYKKWTLKKIGKQLNITEASAKNSKYRCIQSLRKQIKGEN